MTDTAESKGEGRLIPFTVDGQPFSTNDPSQTAASILRLAGLDPAHFDLGELEGRNTLTRSAMPTMRLLSSARMRASWSIRHSADVA